jgi:ferredoxin
MAKYRIEIDKEACVGDGLCQEEACNTFQMSDDDVAEVIDPAGDEPEVILSAAQSCPTEAIILYNIETNAKVYPED